MIKKIVFSAIAICLILSGLIMSDILQTKLEDDMIEKNNLFIGTWLVESPKFSQSTKMIWTFYENGTVKMVTYSLFSWGPSINVSSDNNQKTLTILEIDQNFTHAFEPLVLWDYDFPHHGISPEMSSSSFIRTYDYEYIEWATFQIKDDKLYIEPMSYESSVSNYFVYPCGVEFLVSDDDITLALIEYPLRLTKKPDWNVLKWDNINISISGAHKVNWNLIELDRSNISYTGKTAPSEWKEVRAGDEIKFGKYNSSITVIFTWEPSGKKLGIWHYSRSPETFYVGGIGPNNYTSIKDAINDSLDGDTIYVYNGTYCENIDIDKSVNLVGEDKNNTIIDGSGYGSVLTITADHVNINGFTIQNSGTPSGIKAGINIKSSNNSIINNIIINNYYGIYLDKSNNNTISNNIIKNNSLRGIDLSNSYYNILSNNTFINNGCGILFGDSKNNIVSYNFLDNNHKGIAIFITYSSNNTFIKNTITNSETGIVFDWYCNYNIISGNIIKNNSHYGLTFRNTSNNNIIHHNNLINNAIAKDSGNNTWDDGISEGNYWDDYTGLDADSNGIGDTPYNLSGGENRDNYPFIEPVQI